MLAIGSYRSRSIRRAYLSFIFVERHRGLNCKSQTQSTLLQLTPSSSKSLFNSGSSLTPISASAILSLILLANSKSSRAAAVLLRSLHLPILIPAAANADPADLSRRAYSKRSSKRIRELMLHNNQGWRVIVHYIIL